METTATEPSTYIKQYTRIEINPIDRVIQRLEKLKGVIEDVEVLRMIAVKLEHDIRGYASAAEEYHSHATPIGPEDGLGSRVDHFY